jgi:hypothetical protein
MPLGSVPGFPREKREGEIRMDDKQPSNPIDRLKQKIERSFKDEFPSAPEFFECRSKTVNLAKVDAKALAIEINRHLVDSAKAGKMYRCGVPFSFRSKIAKGEIEVTIRVQAIQAMHQAVMRLAQHPQVRVKANPNGPGMTERDLLALSKAVLEFILAGTAVVVPYTFYKEPMEPTPDNLKRCAEDIQSEIFPPVAKGRPATEVINEDDIPLLLTPAFASFKKRVDAVYAMPEQGSCLNEQQLLHMGSAVANFIKTGLHALMRYKFSIENIIPKQQDLETLVSSMKHDICDPVVGNKPADYRPNESDFEMLLHRAVAAFQQCINAIKQKGADP